MRRSVLVLTLAVLCIAGSARCVAAGLPDKQPNLIHIWRESVKPGRGAEHAKSESGYVAAYEKAGSPAHYLALTSETGADEAWYISAWDSNSAMGEDRKREDKDPVLTAELARLDRIDADYVTAIKKTVAKARPDLSVGEFPDLAKVRFFEITIFRLRPGRDSIFESGAKAYVAAVKRASVKTGSRVYEVVAGMPGPSFIVFTSLVDYAQFDQLATDWNAIWTAATPEEQTAMKNLESDAVIEEETNRFKVDPIQSYVSKETRAKDPEFWSPK